MGCTKQKVGCRKTCSYGIYSSEKVVITLRIERDIERENNAVYMTKTITIIKNPPS